MLIFEGEYIDTEPCLCGRHDIGAHGSGNKTSIILCCYGCGFVTEVYREELGPAFTRLVAFWSRAVNDERVRRIGPRRDTIEAFTHYRFPDQVIRPTPRRPEPMPAEMRTTQPFGVRHNLPPPKPTPPPPEPPPPEPIKELPREYDRYELLELDKNTVQKELTFEGDWFMYIELN